MNPKVDEFNAAQRKAALPRALHVIRLREDGETWESIGNVLGVSRQRAHQIAKANGHKTGAYLAKKALRNWRIRVLYAGGGKTMAEVAAQFHISEGRVWQIVRDYQK